MQLYLIVIYVDSNTKANEHKFRVYVQHFNQNPINYIVNYCNFAH